MPTEALPSKPEVAAESANADAPVDAFGDTERSSSLRRFWVGLVQCLRHAPLGVLAFLAYLCLKSSWIFDETAYLQQTPWHFDFAGWYDAVLVAAVALSFVGGGVRVTKSALMVVGILAVIILASLIPPGPLGLAPALSAAVYFARFAAGFLLAHALTTSLGVEAVEAVVLGATLLLMASSIFVASLQTGGYHQLYYAGMGSGSSGQLTAIACLIALHRKNMVVVFVTSLVMMLILSRTAMVTLLGFAAIQLLLSRRLAPRTRVLVCVLLLLAGLLGLYLVDSFDYFSGILDNRLDLDNISTLAFRINIWDYAVYALRTRDLPLFGLGFNVAPSWILGAHIRTPGGFDFYPPSFHSMFFEYVIGLGVLSPVIFYYLLQRTARSFRLRCNPTCYVFAFFLITQNIDFNVYLPKEVLLWSFLLGMAEADYARAKDLHAVVRKGG
jgi:hypothetical protein